MEVIGYNLYGLLLLSEGEYMLPEVIFSSLLLNEKQKEYRDAESKSREMILAANLGLCMLLQGKYRKALSFFDRYEERLFYLGGISTHLFFEIMRLNCYARLKEVRKYENRSLFAEELYRRIPMSVRQKYTFEELVFHRKKGLLILGN